MVGIERESVAVTVTVSVEDIGVVYDDENVPLLAESVADRVSTSVSVVERLGEISVSVRKSVAVGLDIVTVSVPVCCSEYVFLDRDTDSCAETVRVADNAIVAADCVAERLRETDADRDEESGSLDNDSDTLGDGDNEGLGDGLGDGDSETDTVRVREASREGDVVVDGVADAVAAAETDAPVGVCEAVLESVTWSLTDSEELRDSDGSPVRLTVSDAIADVLSDSDVLSEGLWDGVAEEVSLGLGDSDGEADGDGDDDSESPDGVRTRDAVLL